MILEINTQSPKPIYEQLRDQIVLGIASKQLMPNEALPSVRRLSADLGINLHTVSKAYSVLCEEGYVVMDRKKGAIVSHHVPQDNSFAEALAYRLTLSAAEARCRNMNEEDFAALCRERYQTLL